MKRSRIALIYVLPLLLLLMLSGSALAGSAQDGLVQLEGVTIPWIAPDLVGMEGALVGGDDETQYQCSEIPEGIRILPVDDESDRVKRVSVKRGGDRITWDDTITGTAIDNNGVTYTFLYWNKATFTYNDNDEIVDVKMVDHFHIHGGDVNYVAFFNWRWSYEADGLELDEIYDEGGTLVDIGVAPLYFPTDDGFTESMNIIPDSWNKIVTNGFIFGCDPL